MTHTFAISAYKDSPYLEACIKSIKKQTIYSNIILGTSTPNEHIESLCRKYSIPMYINDGDAGITQDWNFIYKKATTEAVTIAHQDDIYDKKYVEQLEKSLMKARHPIIFFSDYGEIRNGRIVRQNRLLKIKRVMLFPLRIRAFWGSRIVRRGILSMGSPICCPSVAFVRANCPEEIFQHGFRAAEDWQAWERLSRLKGEFVYNKKILMYHRIHEDSETTRVIEKYGRASEDYQMFRKFWPKPIAGLLSKAYRNSENLNDLS